MVTFLIFFVVLINSVFITFFLFISLVTLIFWLESTFSLELSFCTKSCFCFTHLIKLLVSNMIFVFKYFILLIFRMLILKFFNHSVSFLLALWILQVIQIKFIFKIVYVCVFFNIYSIEPLELLLKSFILFQVFGLNIFNTFKTFLSSFKLLSPPLNFVLKFCLILA